MKVSAYFIVLLKHRLKPVYTGNFTWQFYMGKMYVNAHIHWILAANVVNVFLSKTLCSNCFRQPRSRGSNLQLTGIPPRGKQNYSQSLHAEETGDEHRPDKPTWLGTDFTFPKHTFLLKVLATSVNMIYLNYEPQIKREDKLTPLRLEFMATIGFHVFVVGSYLSALLSSVWSSRPPTAKSISL